MSGSVTFERAVLPNGLTVIGERNPDAASVAAGFFVATGSRDETPEVSGVSHFLEHMLFKGNETYTAEDFNRIFDELGARYNASTNTERTLYYGAVLPNKLPDLLALLTQLMRPTLREEDFELEKKVILEEIAMYADRPDYYVFELSSARFWNGHPLGNSVLGTTESITALRRDAMDAYLKQRYSCSNQLLALTGNFDWQAVLDQVEKATLAWEAHPTERVRLDFTPRPGRDSRVDASLKRTHVAVYAPGVGAHDERIYAAAILGAAIGEDEGSRLYWELVDKGLAEEATLGHAVREDQGAFQGYVNAAPERAEQVIDTYLRVLRQVQEEGLSEAEFRRAQRKLATSITLRTETPLGRLTSFGAAYQIYGRQVSVEESLERTLSATLDEAHSLLAEKPFDSLYLFTLGPGAQAPAGDALQE